jgi:hypothetical protein
VHRHRRGAAASNATAPVATALPQTTTWASFTPRPGRTP